MTEVNGEQEKKKEVEFRLEPAEIVMLGDDCAQWIQLVRDEKPEMIYFLDKSARPLFWLLKECEGETPEARFLNIGSENKGIDQQWSSDWIRKNFPEVRRYHPSRVMVVDEKASSGDSLKTASLIVRELYNLAPDAVVKKSVLTMYPSWYGDEAKIGIMNDIYQNILTRRYPSREKSLALRRQIRETVVPTVKMFLARGSEFRQLEDQIAMTSREPFVNYHIPIPRDKLTYHAVDNHYSCEPSVLQELAKQIQSGKMSLEEGMRVYYLIKDNRFRPEDWKTYDFLDLESPSLNTLCGALLNRLTADSKKARSS